MSKWLPQHLSVGQHWGALPGAVFRVRRRCLEGFPCKIVRKAQNIASAYAKAWKDRSEWNELTGNQSVQVPSGHLEPPEPTEEVLKRDHRSDFTRFISTGNRALLTLMDAWPWMRGSTWPAISTTGLR
jgi:hypothetical protein